MPSRQFRGQRLGNFSMLINGFSTLWKILPEEMDAKSLETSVPLSAVLSFSVSEKLLSSYQRVFSQPANSKKKKISQMATSILDIISGVGGRLPESPHFFYYIYILLEHKNTTHVLNKIRNAIVQISKFINI